MVVYGPSLPALPKTPAVSIETPAASKQNASAPGTGDGVGEQSLWGVLTEEERSFFAQQAELGALTYGPKGARAEQLEPPKGQRLDVRV
jgi:hypothetical protein